MEQQTETILRQYLLGQLDDGLQQRVEERLLIDRAFAEQFEEVEQDLADEYAAGALEGAEKRSFERLFLRHPARHRKVAFSRSLRKYIATIQFGPAAASGSRPPWIALLGFIRSQSLGFQVAMAAVVSLLVIATVWLPIRSVRLQQQLDAALADQGTAERASQDLARALDQERARRVQLEREVAGLNAAEQTRKAAAHVTTSFVAFSVLPGLMRDPGEMQRFVIPPDKDYIQLELTLEGNRYSSYVAVLRTVEGSESWREADLRPRDTATGSIVVLRLKRDLLPPRDYVLRLSGKNPDGTSQNVPSYYFRIAAK